MWHYRETFPRCELQDALTIVIGRCAAELAAKFF